MTQFGFLFGSYVLGVLCVLPLKRRLPIGFLCLTGFLWGQALWALVGLACLLTKAPYSPPVMFTLMLAVLVAMLIVNTRCHGFRFSIREWACLLVSAGMFAAALAVALRFNLTFGSADSHYLLSFSRHLFLSQGLAGISASTLGNHGVFSPLAYSAAHFVGVDYFYALQPMFGWTLATAFAWSAWRALRHLQVGRFVAFLLLTAVSLLVSTTFIVDFHVFLIKDNFVSGVFLFVHLVTYWFAISEKNRAWLFFTGLAWLVFCLCRVENPLVAIPFFFILLSERDLTLRQRALLAFPPLFVVIAWYWQLSCAASGGHLKKETAYGLIALFACIVPFVLLSGTAWMKKLLPRVPWIILVVCLLAFGGACFDKPLVMYDAIVDLSENLLMHGAKWGALWYVLLVFMLLAGALPRFANERILGIAIVAFFCLASVTCYYRGGVRLGWGDSTNRMMFHILPSLCFYLLLKYGSAFSRQPTAAPPALATIHRRLFVLIPTLGVLGGLIFLLAARPVDYAVGARYEFVREEGGGASGLLPGYGFDVALEGYVGGDDKYVAARDQGPATIIVDLGKEVEASVLECVGYRAGFGFSDYAWHVSRDGKTWVEVYDTRVVSGLAPPQEIVAKNGYPALRYSLEGKGPFRYVRLRFRAGEGQNRLLMRKLSIYKGRRALGSVIERGAYAPYWKTAGLHDPDPDIRLCVVGQRPLGFNEAFSL